jgi:hypothetical protein
MNRMIPIVRSMTPPFAEGESKPRAPSLRLTPSARHSPWDRPGLQPTPERRKDLSANPRNHVSKDLRAGPDGVEIEEAAPDPNNR